MCCFFSIPNNISLASNVLFFSIPNNISLASNVLIEKSDKIASVITVYFRKHKSS